MKNNLISLCTFYAISPLHAGCGAATSQVDLPIQRERHTNWPHIQASGVKGAFRAHYRLFAGDKLKMINIIFAQMNKMTASSREQNMACQGPFLYQMHTFWLFPCAAILPLLSWSPALLYSRD